MDSLDILYKAYVEYKKNCIVDDVTDRFYSAYKSQNLKENEDVLHIFSICKIEEDWVQAIERGLPYMEKAIKEERQFIRNDGEVIPIEKIRKTSKDSIQDLAKHANYITHEAPEDSASEVMPDKMLMIRKESDYAIYENRVLYAALMYLKDFVMSRLTTIKEASNTYIVKQHIKKLIDMGSRKIDLNLELNERRANDPLLSNQNTEKDIIDRLDVALTQILALLKTPLMREVSKSEMVTRPIQKTNILKMNHNFRESLACFDYIVSYQGQGFTIEHIEKSYYPLDKEMSESYSESVILLSFLDYMYTNEIKDKLQKNYEFNLKQEELKKENEIIERLKNFHATAKEKEKTINEFLLLFEDGYRILEKRNEELNYELKSKEAQYKKEVESLNLLHQDEIRTINKENAAKIEEINKNHEEQLRLKDEEANQKFSSLREECNEEIASMSRRNKEEQEAFKSQFKEHIEEMEKQNQEIRDQHQELLNKIDMMETELLTYKVDNGLVNIKDYGDEESFNKLEELMSRMDKVYEKAWKEAKRNIRKEVFGGKKKK